MTDAPKRMTQGNPLTGEIAEYLRADLIDKDVLARVEAALEAVIAAGSEVINQWGDPFEPEEDWERFVSDAMRLLADASSPARSVLADLRAMMEQLK